MRKTIPILALLLVLGLTLVQVGCSKKEDPVTPPPACSITLDEIHEWEWWYTGTQINIRWARTTGGDVKIELFKGNDLAGTITPSTLNDGFYPWPNSTTFGQESGEDYSIKVTHLTDSDCSNQTGMFELIDVSNCFIKFPWTVKDSIPNLTAGDEFEITWTSDHTSGTVDLELWYEPFGQIGTLVGTIAEGIPDNDSYWWIADSFHRGTDEGYRFKIRDVVSQQCSDTSVRFMIIDEVNCSIDVLGINGGQSYLPGDIIPISFSFENPTSGVVDLRLYSGGNRVDGGQIVENFDTQNGTVIYFWSVTDFGDPEPTINRYNIRAKDSNDEYCVGKSSEFTILR